MLAAIGSFLSLALLVFKAMLKSPFEKEQKKRADVDQEHDQNAKDGRPSGDFWNGRGL